MSKHVVITSFTEDGYQKYGKEFIRTFLEYWPKSVKLVVYYEGTHLRQNWKSINEVPKLREWMTVIAPFQLFSGSLYNQYSIQYDARTNRVIFIHNHALRTFKSKVFWIDGDVITHAPVPETFLDECLPDDKMCCYLGRDGWYDSETGFLGFNYEHPLCEQFLQITENTLFSGIIFAQPNYWDMATRDWSRAAFCSYAPQAKESFIDLAKDLPRGCMHPFINSAIGAYMDHKKGQRKTSRSTRKDLVIDRQEPYWTCPEAYGKPVPA